MSQMSQIKALPIDLRKYVIKKCAGKSCNTIWARSSRRRGRAAEKFFLTDPIIFPKLISEKLYRYAYSGIRELLKIIAILIFVRFLRKG